MYSLKKNWVIVSMWMALFAMFFFILSFDMELQYAALRAGYLISWLFTLHLFNFLLVKRYLVQKSFFKFVGFGLLLVIFISIAKGWIELNGLAEESRPYFLRLQQPRPGFHFFSVISAFLFSTLIWYNKFLKDSERKLLQVQQQQTTAHLNLLQAQIQPHSLFNTLNNIYSLVIEQREEAGEAVLKLSDMLRYAIYKKDDSLEVSVNAEMKQIDTLIWLFQLTDDHNYNISFQKKVKGGKILPMLLIPLVENALKYCDFVFNASAYIEIHVDSSSQNFQFKVINTFDPGLHPTSKDNIGLKNVKERLQLFYPDRHVLHIESENNVFKVNLEIYGTIPMRGSR
ncbi:MAG: sensor histidine kinase [Cyclobacteriaceae bacterium]